MNKPALAGLIQPAFLLPHLPWTQRQQVLSDKLCQAVVDYCIDPQDFAISALKVIDGLGSCQGLATCHRVRGEDHTLLGHFLKSLGQLVVDENPDLTDLLSRLLFVIEIWDSCLDRLAPTPGFEFLTERPDSHNRTLHHQLCLVKAPAYYLVGAALHRGICAKARQLNQRSDLKEKDKLIGEFSTPSIRIAKALPEARIRERLSDYSPGEFDHLVFKTIQGLKKQLRIGSSRNYTGNTRRTLWSDWLAIFYANPDQKRFVDGLRGFSVRSPYFDPFTEPDFDLLAPSSRSRKAYAGICEQQTRQEQVNLFGESERRTEKGLLNSSVHKMDGGHAVLAAQPTAAMPGVLSAVVLRLIVGSGISRSGERLDQTEQAFVQLMLHTGRPAEWLLSLRLGSKPESFWECEFPVYVPKENSIFFTPEIYPGLPESLWPSRKLSWDEYSKKWAFHDRVFEPVALVFQLPLPDPLAELVSEVITRRAEILDRFPESVDRRGLSTHSGGLWLSVSESGIQPWNRKTFSDLLCRMNMLVQASIPKHSRIRGANLSRSYHGYYADAGLRPEFRSYISGRLSYPVELPLRYSRFGSDQVLEAYFFAYENVSRRINKTESDYVAPHINESLHTSWVGSWRVLRADHVVQLVRVLHEQLDHPDTLHGTLNIEQSHHNSETLYALFMLMLLLGLRPLEIPRIKPLHMDLQAGRLAVHGKARSIGQAYRWLPIFSGLHECLGRQLHSDRPGQRKNLFYLYGRTGVEWPISSTVRLNRAFKSVAEKAGLISDLDLYGLRHRFRSDMLELGISNHLLNYLMGHERPGDEAYNYYLDRSLSGLVPVYEEAARAIVVKYGVLR